MAVCEGERETSRAVEDINHLVELVRARGSIHHDVGALGCGEVSRSRESCADPYRYSESSVCR